LLFPSGRKSRKIERQFALTPRIDVPETGIGAARTPDQSTSRATPHPRRTSRSRERAYNVGLAARLYVSRMEGRGADEADVNRGTLAKRLFSYAALRADTREAEANNAEEHLAQVEGLGTPPKKFGLKAAFSSKKLDQVLGRSD
jgi:hypothetical protein